MTRPQYAQNDSLALFPVSYFDHIPWVNVTPARAECFMANLDYKYTYGDGPGRRTYQAEYLDPCVARIMHGLNIATGNVGLYNVCFLNRYDDERQALGWHSDDSPGMDLDHPIAVISFGEPREIWWREKGHKGAIPAEQRQLLEHGSVFEMPAGFQRTHQHKIPKGDHKMGPRVSLTFRHYQPQDA